MSEKLSERLYELTETYRTLQLILDTAENPEEYQAALDELKDSIENKVENIGKFILSLEADEEAIGTELVRLAARKQAITNRKNHLKNYLLTEMRTAGLDKVKKPLFTVSVRNNPPSVQIDDPADIPLEYRRVIPEHTEPDKKAILEYFKATGENVRGAQVVTDRKSLQIK